MSKEHTTADVEITLTIEGGREKNPAVLKGLLKEGLDAVIEADPEATFELSIRKSSGNAEAGNGASKMTSLSPEVFEALEEISHQGPMKLGALRRIAEELGA